MNLPDLVDLFVKTKPGWRWAQAQHDGVVDCHLYAPEIEGSNAPARDRIGLSYRGRGDSVERAFADALGKILGRNL